MPNVTAVANAVTKRLPRVVSPRNHAIADYLVLGSLLVAGAFFWRRNPRAAKGALLCAGAELATNLFTDYPGGVARLISYQNHGKIEVGLAAMMATMPEFLTFYDQQAKAFFTAEAAVVTAVANLTDFRPRPVRAASRVVRSVG